MIKKFLRVLKWVALSLILIILLLFTTVKFRQHLTYDAPYPDVHASNDSAVIARGRQLVLGAAHCPSCHGPKNTEELLKAGREVPLSGGQELKFPIGSIFIKNITPDTATGIGRRTDGEIARVLRFGVHATGTAVFNFMPFHNMSDEDLRAIISYLRVQQPVYNKVPDHDLNLIGQAIVAFLIKPVGPEGEIPITVKADSSIAYGQYLSSYVANCTGCHTEKNFLTGKYEGKKLAGGGTFIIPGKPTLISPNITGDSSSRIYKWDEQTFVNRFRSGKLIEHSPMPWTSFSNMTDVELKAIYRYLKSVQTQQ